jgi:hypothetical protein
VGGEVFALNIGEKAGVVNGVDFVFLSYRLCIWP